MLHRSKASAVGAITVRRVVPAPLKVSNLTEGGELQGSGKQHGLAEVVKCQLVLDNRQDFHQEREQRTAEPLAAIPFELSWCGGTLCPATPEPRQYALEMALNGQGVPRSDALCWHSGALPPHQPVLSRSTTPSTPSAQVQHWQTRSIETIRTQHQRVPPAQQLTTPSHRKSSGRAA